MIKRESRRRLSRAAFFVSLSLSQTSGAFRAPLPRTIFLSALSTLALTRHIIITPPSTPRMNAYASSSKEQICSALTAVANAWSFVMNDIDVTIIPCE